MRGHVTGPLEENVFLLVDAETKRAAILDPGIESEGLLETIQRERWQLDYIINSHGHFDHVFANAFYKGRTGAELLIHEADLPLLERLVENSMVFGFRPSPSPRSAIEAAYARSLPSATRNERSMAFFSR